MGKDVSLDKALARSANDFLTAVTQRGPFHSCDLLSNNKAREILFDLAIKAPILQQLESLASKGYEAFITARASCVVAQKDTPTSSERDACSSESNFDKFALGTGTIVKVL